MTVLERLLTYVSIDTQSDPTCDLCPSTEKQKDLGRLLVTELEAMGLDAFMDAHGYVYTKIESNLDYEVDAIGFVAHMDTSFDAPGANVKPRVINNYDGSVIKLNKELSMDPKHFTVLNRVIGQDLVVTDGNTLLGADDKAGVAEIMQLCEFLTTNKEFKHGDVYIGFTPDEEIGRGADLFDLDYFKAKYAYTADGSEVGGIEYENFNAATANIKFIGKSIHPGSAKNKLINAMHIAFEFNQQLPVFLNPAYTEGYEGFNHLSHMEGSVEEAKLQYIIRNHDKEKFESQKRDFEQITTYLNQKYGYEAVNLTITDSYFNMYEILKNDMSPIEIAKEAITNSGVTPYSLAIRGGTDGARLTFMGLPCPNLGTGGYNFHGRYEFASVNQMEKAVEILIEICRLVTIK